MLAAFRRGEPLVPLLGGGFAPLPADWLARFGGPLADLLAARDAKGRVAGAALPDLARLAVMPPRDLAELRTEAAATLATPDIRQAARVELPADDLASFTFSADGRTLLTAGHKTGLDFWGISGNGYLSFVEGLTVSQPGFDKVVCLPQGQGLAVGTRAQGVVFTDRYGICTTHTPITQGASQPTKLAVDASGERLEPASSLGGRKHAE